MHLIALCGELALEDAMDLTELVMMMMMMMMMTMIHNGYL